MLETKGQRTRNSILETAAALATEEGLEPLSIGRLAEETGMSKSGLFAHFGSKEELQLATVDHAAAMFVAEVIAPARAAPRGLARVWALCDHMIDYSERQVFPGGCFFACTSFEFNNRPGPVRDRIEEMIRSWLSYLEHAVEQAQEGGLDHPSRKLPQRWGPSGVSTDSGWNCTPSTRSVRWRTAITSPSSVVAEISSSSGTVFAASEW